MFSEDDIQYALEATEVIYEPDRRIDTFGDTRFSFILLSEPMDSIGMSRVRTGWVEADKPKIIKPDLYNAIDVEGFGEDAARFFKWLSKQAKAYQSLLQYGFQFKRSEVQEELVHEPIEELAEKLKRETLDSGDSLKAVIRGVDDAWEVCLLKFTVEMVQKSHEINLFDFRRKGLL